MNAIGYARISTEEQDKMFGLDTQRNDIEQYADLHGMDLLDIYTDDVSGASKFYDRVAGAQVRQAISSDQADIVIMPRYNRFSRAEDPIDFYTLLAHVDNHSAEWHFTDTGRVTNDIAGQILATVNQYSASADRQERADKTRKGKTQKALQGQHVGQGYPNYGYQKIYNPDTDKKDLTIDPVEAGNVRKIFEMYTTGISLREVVRELDKQGIRPPNKTKRSAEYWGVSTLRKILTNPIYVGLYYYGKTRNEYTDNRKTKSRKVAVPRSEWITVPLPELRIVSDELFEQVARRLDLNRDDYTKVRDRKIRYHYQLAGFVRCECGSPVSGYYPKSRKPQYRLNCQEGEQATAGSCKRGDTGVRMAHLIEQEVFTRVFTAVNDPKHLEEQIDAFNKDLLDKQGSMAQKITDLENLIQDLDLQIGNLKEGLGYTNNPDTMQVITTQMDEFSRTKTQAQAELSELTAQVGDPLDSQEFINAVQVWSGEQFKVVKEFYGEQAGETTEDGFEDSWEAQLYFSSHELAPKLWTFLTETNPQEVRDLYNSVGLQVVWNRAGTLDIRLTLGNPSERVPW